MSTCAGKLGPDAIDCDPELCANARYTSKFHAICECIDWQGNPIPNCTPVLGMPVQFVECRNPETGEVRNVTVDDCVRIGTPWVPTPCYCCCPGGTASMMVAAPSGTRALGSLAVGDSILVAHLSGGRMAWQRADVAFSATSAPASSGGVAPPLMIHIEFGDAQILIANAGQLVLLPGGVLKRADQLVPGADRMVDRDGTPLPILRVASGYYRGAIHYMATSTASPAEWDGRLDGHLVELNGAVVGDYLLDLLADSPKMAQHLADAGAPTLGTEAYRAAAPHVAMQPFAIGSADAVAGHEATSPDFEALRADANAIPGDASTLFTPTQEAFLASPAVPKRGFSDDTNVAKTQYYIKLFSGFFPKVTVSLDWQSTRPNVFAYERLWSQHVVIGGAFLRLQPIYGEAIAVALAFGLANRLIVADATNVGHSLYDGIGSVLPQALQGGDLHATLVAAQRQFDALLALLEAPSTAAVATTLTPACIGEVIDAAISGGPFPVCAG